ncbi:dTDP-4-dehydrorhamnose 3,5-epimerase [Mangrovimonas xylaniphaga]|uniref:dTDP-4-dehydrorhamnose 3,5-epimerase n=1 Tax=Mangrovimonas xylaniphaga TaxID=1645915 RepID=UPI0006B4348C|nr:dTDP-4-dehydrorhamnose 3,5-epimerase [Mangrovimonas xylaniphaga]
MRVEETNLKGCFIIHPTVFEDKRGFFLESFNQERFNKAIGKNITFVQDNESFSTKGVLRGLHYQTGDHAQAKLVRVIKGRVLDVAVDIRLDSPTYGEHVAVELSEENKTQLFVPRGFAHGFVVLSETAIFSYKCDNFYNKASEGGIIYNDPSLNIDWQLSNEELIVSEKDAVLPILEKALI